VKTLANHAATKSRRIALRQNQTLTEFILWKHLRNKQLNRKKFYRQYSIGSFIVDFYNHEHKLVIELDGSQHADNQYYDAKRTLFLKKQGITVIRIWNNEVVKNLSGVLEVINNYLK